MRGVVSLASALAIPLLLSDGKPFPHRNLILFITFIAIIVTLVGQGLALPWIIRWVKPESLGKKKPDDEQVMEIELHLKTAAVKELRSKYAAELEANEMLRNRMELLAYKVKLYTEFGENTEKRVKVLEEISRFKKIMVAVIEHERNKLHSFRNKDGYDDDIIRLTEKRLDLDEERLEDEDG